MKSVRKRRGVHALVFAGLVGVLTLGLATQAMACGGCPTPTPVFAGANFKQQVGNTTVTANVTTVGTGETIVATLATGTFAGTVTCGDNITPNSGYTNVIDQNGGTGRLVVCVKPAGHAPGINAVTATYPGFAGLSVLNVVRLSGDVSAAGLRNVGAGSNPTVSSGTIHISTPDNLLFGVVSNSNTANFVPDPGWTAIPGATTAFGTGAGRRNITPVFRFTDNAPPADYAVTGTPPGHGLTGSGFWQAAIGQFQQFGCDTRTRTNHTRLRGLDFAPAPDPRPG